MVGVVGRVGEGGEENSGINNDVEVGPPEIGKKGRGGRTHLGEMMTSTLDSDNHQSGRID